MDPLSLTSTLITLIGAGGSTVHGIQRLISLRRAPYALLALNNEISDLQLVILETHDLLLECENSRHSRDISQAFTACLGPILNRAREKLLELDMLIQYRLTIQETGSEARLNRTGWLREQRNIRRIQEEIRSTKLNLVAAIGVLTSRAALRVQLQISELRFINNDIQSSQRQNHATTTQSLQDLDQIGRHVYHAIEVQRETERRLNDLFCQYASNRERPTLPSHEIPSGSLADPKERNKVEPWGVELNVRRQTRAVCVPDCTCCCHRLTAWRSSSYLNSFLGRLFVGYIGLPWLTPDCDAIRCHRISEPAASIRYYFPKWFATHVLEMSIQFSQPDGVTQRLRVSHVVTDNSEGVRLTLDGDVEGLKRLLSSRKCSPFDTIEGTGDTLLAQAVRSGQVGSCQLLLSAAADPYRENYESKSPHFLAWSQILGAGPQMIPLANELKSMFPDTDLDEYGFNVVHQQVLGLNGLDLKEILSECSTKTLNEGDLVYNRTALFWSARRGDMDAVETLISSGADTNKADYESVTPLSHSVNCIQPSNLSTFGLLLQHGADVHTANVYGWTTLHRLATFNPSTRGFSSSNFTALKLLVHSGINVNAQNWRGVTPLMHTIEFKNFQMTTKLIHLGADVHLKDCNRHNALCSAVVFHEHPLIQLLLECGADHIGKIDGAEGSLLHVAAEYADIKSLQVLTSGRLATRGIHYKRREDGLTPIEVARARTDVSPEWIDACQEFFWSVDETRNAPRGHNQPETYGFGSRFSCGDDNDDDDVDIFVDALEE